ncbi:MAG: DM13 domain-containing protein [Alphaproteobacteria bacterium]|nr:DM13 domain-containing protein [Alphaproteobacteria bacterium]
MKKFLLGLFSGGILGTALGFAIGIFIYPFIFLAGIEAQETLSEINTTSGETRTLLASGEFQHVNPNDRVHWGRGTVSLYQEPDGKIVVFLEDTFEVGPGPAYRVYVKDAAEITSKNDFQQSEGENLGTLRAFKGSQVYEVPDTVSADSIKSVVIWCEQFSVLISPATLNPS